MKIFLDFCSNHGDARAAVESLKNRNLQFAKFLDECMRIPECRLMEFESFLIKPMQRVTRYCLILGTSFYGCFFDKFTFRYPLLIRELLKYTSPTHSDYFNLVKAQIELQRLVHEANERKRSLEYQI